MSSIELALEAYHFYFQSSVKEFIKPRKTVADELEDAFLREIVERRLQRVEEALRTNSEIAQAIQENAITLLKASSIPYRPDFEPKSSFVDIVARSTIRQFWRDWSNDPDSHIERNSATKVLIKSLKTSLPRNTSPTRPSVLVPGSGLSRLAVDLALDGYQVEANELSISHLFAVAWVLHEQIKPCPRLFKLHPWATQFSNHVKASRQFDSVIIPTRDSRDSKVGFLPAPELECDQSGHLLLRAGSHFQMTTCDFVNGYGPVQPKYGPVLKPTSRTSSSSSIKSIERPQLSPSPSPRKLFDAVVTMFFLDTAPNVLDYIRTVHHALREGGVWLNSGPLLWHAWENGPSGRGEGDSDQDETAKSRGVRGLFEGNERVSLQDEDDEKSTMPSVEISWDDLLILLTRNGFRILESHYGDQAGFVSDVKSMGIYGYRIGFFKAIKDSSG